MADLDNLVAQLTLEEKVDLLQGVNTWTTQPVERLGIRSLYLTDGPHGVRKVREAGGGFALENSDPSTSFPTSSAIASSWDPENARRIGEALGRECAAQGVDVLLAPGVNIVRDPRCGRNFEYFSEDPLVSGVFGAAVVAGVQSQGVMACIKHFAANSNEDYRFVGNSIVDERALREIYLRAFERIVKEAAPATVMCAYNRLGDVFCSESPELLTSILREEWGFDGLVMTDWGATHDRVAGVRAGTDLDMPGGVAHNRAALLAAVRSGVLAEADLDRAVRRVLALVQRCADAPGPDPDLAAHARLARDAAVDSAVLLRNDGILPLSAGGGQRIAVIGEMFTNLRFQGAGSSLVTPPHVVSAREAFDRRGIRYVHSLGYRSLDSLPDAALIAEAVQTAREAEVVLFFGGLGDLEESEGFDRAHLRLGEAQQALLSALVETGVPVVLVLHAGAPVELPLLDRLAAVLHMHLPGMEGGEATAALLFGEENPSGRLTVSWPRSIADTSARADYGRGAASLYYESIYVGYRFHDKAGTDLLFPFGHGLSYTRFAYRDLAVAQEGGGVTVSLTVANTGDRDGAEVVQLYVGKTGGAIFTPRKELRAFTKVRVRAGAEVRATMSFALSDLAHWDAAEHDWRLEDGEYEVIAAASASDIRLRAPLRVTTGSAPRSPYGEAVERAYAMPPTEVPDAFWELLGRTQPAEDVADFSLETRLADARGSLIGALMRRAIVGRALRDYRRALAAPASIERDARVKSAHFVLRMMPNASLRSLAMASSGQLPYHVAAGISDLASGHPIRGLRKLATGRTVS